MRDALQIVTPPDTALINTQFRLNVPGAVTRLVGLKLAFSAHTTNENINLLFSLIGLELLAVPSPVIQATAGTIAWQLGGELSYPLNISFNPATGVQTYAAPLYHSAPLPDLWWDDGNAVNLTFASTGSGELFTQMVLIREVKYLK